MIHPTTIRAPEILRSFAIEAARAGFDAYPFLGADLDGRVLAQIALPTEEEIAALPPIARDGLFELESRIDDLDLTEDDAAGELAYGRWVPFEVVPFAWQGGDALHYGHLVMAEELGELDWMTVSFAPSDEVVSWLGDDTAEGLANLLATAELFDREERSEPVPRAALAATLRLPAGAALGRGARSGRRATPRIPPGYHFERGARGVGVLAPHASFSGLAPASVPFETIEDAASAALADGHAGTALLLLQLMRAEADGAGERDACERMIAVYAALGRPTMARRVEAHLRLSLFT